MDGILLVAHGTIAELSELPAFLRRIRRGREPTTALVAEMEHRYRAIGGSPLLAMTRQQASALSELARLPVWVAMRLWDPSVGTVLEEVAQAGVDRLSVIALAPFSVEVYLDAARAAQAEASPAAQRIQLLGASAWGEHPRFVRAHADLIRRHAPAGPYELILTAHSLPLAAIRAGDKYAQEVTACARAIERELGQDAHLVYQSEGADGGEWLGPGLKQTLQACAARGCERVVVAPFGFLADHVETLYDLDLEASVWAAELGLQWVRVPALNADPELVAALADLAKSTLG